MMARVHMGTWEVYPGRPEPARVGGGVSVMDSKLVMSLGQLTDDKSALRQRDLKLRVRN